MRGALTFGPVLTTGVALLIAGVSLPVCAQANPESPVDGPWTFQVAPYLWGMGVKGTVATLPPLPPASVDAGFDDLIENLNGALMLQAEARKGRIGIFVDLVYANLSMEGSTPGSLFSGVDLDIETFSPTVLGYYRAELQPGATLDLMAGFRAWYVSTDVHLHTGVLQGRSGGESESWVDPCWACA